MSSIPLPALSIRPPDLSEPAKNAMASRMQGAQLQAMDQEKQLRAQEIQKGQMAQDDQKKVREAFQKNGGDIDKTIADSAKAGVSPQMLTQLQQHSIDVKTKLAGLNADQLKNAASQNDNLIGVLKPIADAPAEKKAALYNSARQTVLQNPNAYGITDPNQIPEQYPGDEAITQQMLLHQGGKQQFEQQMKAREVVAQETRAKNTGGVDMAMFNSLQNPQGAQPQNPPPDQVPSAVPVNPPATGQPTDNSYAAAQAAFNASRQNGAQPQASVPVGSLSPTEAFQKLQEMKQDAKPDKSVPVDQQELADFMKNPPTGYTGTPTQYAKWKASLTPAAVQIIADKAAKSLTDSALDNAAEKYWSQGVLPAGGRGPAVMAQNQKIMNRAAELHSGESITEGSAAYAANKHSLSKLQGNFDQVTAFENTAGKNLDVFLNTAKKVVDVGSPWINKPLRSIDAGGLGAEDQAAFNAARITALTEIAKVLNSSNASGVLSDSARHEVEGLIGPGATLKMIVSAANILKTDMANRHQSYQEQIDDIKGRLGGKPATNNTPPSATGGFNWNAHPKVNQ